MTLYQRSAQVWSILVYAAINQKLVTYKLIRQLTNLPTQGLGTYLAPLQDYCRRKGLPPLTSIVINESTGLPGEGFTESGDNVLAQQSRVFVFNWLEHSAPTEEELERYLPKKKSKAPAE